MRAITVVYNSVARVGSIYALRSSAWGQNGGLGSHRLSSFEPTVIADVPTRRIDDRTAG